MENSQMYRVNFVDKTEFDGGDINAPKWTKCPEKDIESMDIFLPYVWISKGLQ